MNQQNYRDQNAGDGELSGDFQGAGAEMPPGEDPMAGGAPPAPM